MFAPKFSHSETFVSARSDLVSLISIPSFFSQRSSCISPTTRQYGNHYSYLDCVLLCYFHPTWIRELKFSAEVSICLNTGLILTSVLALRQISNASLGIMGTDTIAIFVLFYTSHITCALCVEKYVLPKESQSFEWSLAYKMLFSVRFIGINREAPNVQKFAQAQNDIESLKESLAIYHAHTSTELKIFPRWPRFHFLRTRGLSLLTFYAIDQFYSYLYDSVLPNVLIQSTSTACFLPSRPTFAESLLLPFVKQSSASGWCFPGHGTPTNSTPHRPHPRPHIRSRWP